MPSLWVASTLTLIVTPCDFTTHACTHAHFAPAGKVRSPGTKTLFSLLRCDDMAFLDLLDACLR